MGDVPKSYEDPSETLFNVLGDTTRLRILYALFEEVGPATESATIAFSELYDHVEYDTPGNFSYHIDQLTNARLVDQIDDEYTLSLPGTMVVRKLLAGWAFANGDSMIEPTTIDAECPRCGTSVKMSYYAGILRIHCPSCVEGIDGERDRAHMSGNHPAKTPFIGMSVPPTGVIGREPEELFNVACAYFFSRMQAHLDGVCPTCASRVTQIIEILDEPNYPTGFPEIDRSDPLGVVESVCRNCRTHVTIPVRQAIQTQPAVTAFYHHHGIEHRFASWAAYKRSWTYEEELLSEDPVRIRVTVPCGGDSLRLTVTHDFRIVEESLEGSQSGR